MDSMDRAPSKIWTGFLRISLGVEGLNIDSMDRKLFFLNYFFFLLCIYLNTYKNRKVCQYCPYLGTFLLTNYFFYCPYPVHILSISFKAKMKNGGERCLK